MPTRSLILSVALILFLLAHYFFKPNELADITFHPLLAGISYVLGISILYRSQRFLSVARAFGIGLVCLAFGKFLIFEVFLNVSITSYNQDAMGFFVALVGFICMRTPNIESKRYRVTDLLVILFLVGLLTSLSSIKFFIPGVLLLIAFMQKTFLLKFWWFHSHSCSCLR